MFDLVNCCMLVKIKEFESLCKTMLIWKSLMKVIILVLIL